MPIALLLAFMFGLLCFAGWLYGALALGDFALSRFKQNGETSLYLSALIGVIILTLAAGIPYLGALIAFLTIFFGFGAIILVRYKNEKD